MRGWAPEHASARTRTRTRTRALREAAVSAAAVFLRPAVTIAYAHCSPQGPAERRVGGSVVLQHGHAAAREGGGHAGHEPQPGAEGAHRRSRRGGRARARGGVRQAGVGGWMRLWEGGGAVSGRMCRRRRDAVADARERVWEGLEVGGGLGAPRPNGRGVPGSGCLHGGALL